MRCGRQGGWRCEYLPGKGVPAQRPLVRSVASFLLLLLLIQVMEEVMAKSKAFKAERQRQKEEDEDETTALDEQFK